MSTPSATVNFTIYVESDPSWPNQEQWIVVVTRGNEVIGRSEGISAYDVMGEAARIIDKAAVAAR